MQVVNPVATTCCSINFSLFANTFDYQTVIVLLNQLYRPIVTVSTSLMQLLFVLIAEVVAINFDLASSVIKIRFDSLYACT